MATFTRIEMDETGRAKYRLNGSKTSTLRTGPKMFNGAPPETLEIDGDFYTGKKKMTKEERAALPKPTLAQRAEAARKRADALAAKLAAASA